MKKITLNVEGMHCDSCSKLIEAELEDKVSKIAVSAKDKKAVIEFDENKISLQKIKEIIKELGYQA